MAGTCGGFVYRFTHLKENSPLADENWYYLRDTSACCFANGQIAMTVGDLNETQMLLVGCEYERHNQEYQGPIMRFHKEGLEVDGEIWPDVVDNTWRGDDCYWQPKLNISTRIFDQDTGDWYEYCVTTETDLRNTKMTVQDEGEGMQMIQGNFVSCRFWPGCPWDRDESDKVEFKVWKHKSSHFSVRNLTENSIKVNGNLVGKYPPRDGNLLEWIKRGRKYTVEDASIVVEARFGNDFKMTFQAFTPPERILEGVTLQLQVREEMWTGIQKMWASIEREIEGVYA